MSVPDELARARRDEIVNACAELYETMSFRDITLKEIGQRTSFTRTSIYNYFQTREEIFLALFQREYEDWTHDLLLLRCSHEAMTAEEFACALAETLARRERLLKLMSMNLYDMEDNSRMENLVAFKRTYAGAIHALAGCLEKFFPRMSEDEVRRLIYTLLPFLFAALVDFGFALLRVPFRADTGTEPTPVALILARLCSRILIVICLIRHIR